MNGEAEVQLPLAVFPFLLYGSNLRSDLVDRRQVISSGVRAGADYTDPPCITR